MEYQIMHALTYEISSMDEVTVAQIADILEKSYKPTDVIASAHQLGEADQLEWADALLTAALTIWTNPPELYTLGGIIKVALKQWDDACELLIKVIQNEKGKAPESAFIMLSRAQLCRGDLDQARKALQVGLLVYPDSKVLTEHAEELLAKWTEEKLEPVQAAA
jgi:tetratricopeptide (TPR) repeat protein